MNSGLPPYRLSKVGLNAITRCVFCSSFFLLPLSSLIIVATIDFLPSHIPTHDKSIYADELKKKELSDVKINSLYSHPPHILFIITKIDALASSRLT